MSVVCVAVSVARPHEHMWRLGAKADSSTCAAGWRLILAPVLEHSHLPNPSDLAS